MKQKIQAIIDGIKASGSMTIELEAQLLALGEKKQEIQNPKIIGLIVPGATYLLPTYHVTNDGIVDGEGQYLHFCKGAKDDESIGRQEGVFVESLLKLVSIHLAAVNVGDLASRETSLAITKVDEALLWLDKRKEDRMLRGVHQTYKK